MKTESLGIGIDLVELDRFKTAFGRKGFKEKVFTLAEIEACENKPDALQSFAVRFAAKEAFFKALADPSLKSIPWKQIEIFEIDSIPQIKATGKLKKDLKQKSLSVSLTHTEKSAAAVVLILPSEAMLLSQHHDQGEP